MLLRDILTTRELLYARLVAECYSNAEIGVILRVSKDFAKYKMQGIYRKLGIQEGHCKSRIMLAVRYDREYRGKKL